MTWKSNGLNQKITPEMMYFIEALKVEGYWSIDHHSGEIQNKNVPLILYFEKILSDFKVKTSKRILMKIKPTNQDFCKKDIKVLLGMKEIGFHFEYSPFDKSKKIVFYLPYKVDYNIIIQFKQQTIPIKTHVGTENVEIECIYPSFGYIGLRFFNTDFIKFVDGLSFGKGSHKIRINPLLFQAEPILVASALSAVIDCEGSLDYYRHFRKIRLRMCNFKYLKDWQNLLKKFDISCRVDSEGLAIEGWEDFDKLINLGIKLFHSKKSKKWYKIINSYKRKQVSRNTALSFYAKELRKINTPILASEFAKIVGKSKRVVNHYLLKLEKQNLLNIDKSNVGWKYSVKEIKNQPRD